MPFLSSQNFCLTFLCRFRPPSSVLFAVAGAGPLFPPQRGHVAFESLGVLGCCLLRENRTRGNTGGHSGETGRAGVPVGTPARGSFVIIGVVQVLAAQVVCLLYGDASAPLVGVDGAVRSSTGVVITPAPSSAGRCYPARRVPSQHRFSRSSRASFGILPVPQRS